MTFCLGAEACSIETQAKVHNLELKMPGAPNLKSRRPLYFLIGDLSCHGGQERVMSLWARLISKQGRRVTFVDERGGPPFFELANIPIEKLPFRNEAGVRKNPFLLLLRIVRFARWFYPKESSTVIMTKSIYLSVIPFLWLMPRRRRHRFVYFSHTSTTQFIERFPGLVGRLILNQLDKLICLYDDSEFQPTWLRPKLLILGNPSPFAPEVRVSEQKNVLFIGRLSPEKDLDLLLEAWKIIEEGPLPSIWRLKIVGSGPEEERLRIKAHILKLERIDWVPATPEVAKEYRESAVMVMTSHFEGLPMVMLEALSFGLPIVTTKHAGADRILTEELSHGKTLTRSPLEFAERLNRILKDDELRRHLSDLALKRAGDFQPEALLPFWEQL